VRSAHPEAPVVSDKTIAKDPANDRTTADLVADS